MPRSSNTPFTAMAAETALDHPAYNAKCVSITDNSVAVTPLSSALANCCGNSTVLLPAISAATVTTLRSRADRPGRCHRSPSTMRSRYCCRAGDTAPRSDAAGRDPCAHAASTDSAAIAPATSGILWILISSARVLVVGDLFHPVDVAAVDG